VTRFVFTRLLAGLATLFAVSVVVFLATEILPGDVARAVLGRDATPATLKIVRERLHADRPPLTQYATWLWGMARGDFGISLAASSSGLVDQGPNQTFPVTKFLKQPLQNTLGLMAFTTLMLVPLSLLLGTVAAIKRDRLLDRIIGVTTLSIVSVPDFVVAVVLILLFALAWPVLPAVSLVDSSRPLLGQPTVVVLPALTLLAAMLAQTTRMVRAGVLQTLDSDYVQMARLKGLSPAVIWRRYVLRNAMAASVQVFAVNIAWMFGGIIVIETVFQYPGIGLQLIQSISARDVPVVQAIALVIASAYVVINLFADIVTLLLTPKLRTAL
jgi:peptide/nickel transport system permease protein